MRRFSTRKWRNLRRIGNSSLYFDKFRHFLNSGLPSLAIVIILFLCNPVKAQKEIKIRGVKGVWTSKELSVEALKQKALEEAKKEALRKAGVSENITASDLLNIMQDKADYRQIFNSISAVEISGEVIVDSIISNKIITDQFENFSAEAIIEARVIKYDVRNDPTFRISVDGINEIYREHAEVRFTFTPFYDGFLKIFSISPSEWTILYPSNYDIDQKFEKGQIYHFPISKKIASYYVEPVTERETNHLVFVFTKKNIPYDRKKLDYKNIIEWIYSIPLDQRIVNYQAFIVTKE